MSAPRPRPHQLEAIAAAEDALRRGDRACLLMACGTGKTLVGRWLAERRRAAAVLVVVPSLALIAQTLAEWRAAGPAADGAPPWRFEALIICSDPSTADGAMERAGSDGQDIPAPFWARHRARVTTSTRAAAAVLAARPPGRPLVVLSTYHSAHVAASAAAAAGVRYGLVVADEAHHLAGHPRPEFRTVLGPQLPAEARLYMTATAVTAAAPAAARDGWSPPLSMADPALFGPVAHRLGFAEAIGRGLLCDYEVVVYEAPAGAGGAPDPLSALASAAAGLSRVLTFHGRVDKARAFAAAVDGRLLPDGRRVRAVAVAGADPALHRQRSLRLLQRPDPGTLVVVSSARCLAEGVDVPAVDGVLFADPSASDVAIVQAVGRALRLAPGKTAGRVLLPVVCPAGLDEDTALSTSPFAAVWRILRSLRAADPRLAADLEAVRRTAPRGAAGGPRRGRVSFELPSAPRDLVPRLVRSTAPAWDRRFAELEAFAAARGAADPPAATPLGRWCEQQRTARRRGLLLPDRAAALAGLPGWTWDAAMRAWSEQLRQVLAAVPPGGLLDVHDPQAMARRLRGAGRGGAATVGRWCAEQRILARRGALDPARRAALESVPGWTYRPLPPDDAACLDLLAEYVAWKGDANPPPDYVEDDLPVGAWLAGLRRRRALGTLGRALLDELEACTPPPGAPGALRWDAAGTRWALTLRALHRYAAREGGCAIPEDHLETVDGAAYALYAWCRAQRHARRTGALDPARAAALERVPGWRWEIPPAPRAAADIGASAHGTRTGYVKGCRCEPCTAANRADRADRDRRARLGAPGTDLVPADAAREHLRSLVAGGAARKALARAAGTTAATIAEILDGRRGRLQPATEQTLLALTPQCAAAAAAPSTLVPAEATLALVGDLLALGWPKSWIAREAGLGASLQLRPGLITAASAARIAGLHARVGARRAPPRPARRPLPPLSEIAGPAGLS